MKPSQFQSRLSALVAEAIQSRVPPAVVCNALKANFDAVMNAARTAQREATTDELTEKILAKPSDKSLDDLKAVRETLNAQPVPDGVQPICLNPSRSSK